MKDEAIFVFQILSSSGEKMNEGEHPVGQWQWQIYPLNSLYQFGRLCRYALTSRAAYPTTGT